MHAYLIYLIQTTLIAGILFGYYYIVLRNKPMNRFNRFYLLASLLISLVAPLLHLEWNINGGAYPPNIISLLEVISSNDKEEVLTVTETKSWHWSFIIWLGYFLIVGFMLTVTLAKIVRLLKLKNRLEVIKHAGTSVVMTDLDIAPCSFFNTIYWKKSIDINSPVGQQILGHELTHIRQYHSLDNIGSSVLLAFFWMNPFYWLIKSELSAVHEFLADEGCLAPQDSHSLATMLLHSHLGYSPTDIIQSFYHSPIKRRLDMIQAAKRPSSMRIIMALAVIVMTSLLCSFTIKEQTTYKAQHKTIIVVDAGHGGIDEGAKSATGITEKDLTLRISHALAKLAPEYNIDVVQTREDRNVSLEERRKVALSASAQMFISIHISKKPVHQYITNGYQVIVSKKNSMYDASRTLASAILGQLSTSNSAILEKNIKVLHQDFVPAILIECGNIDDVNDLKMLQNDEQLESMCRKILEGVVIYKNSHE